MKALSKTVFWVIMAGMALPLFAAETTTRFDRPGLQFGFHAGMTFGNARTPVDISSSTYTGFLVGLKTELALAPIFSIQPEMSYSRRGVDLANAAGVRVSARYDSLEVPVLLKLRGSSTVTPSLMTGPMATFNLSRNVDIVAGSTVGTVSFNPKTVDIGWVVGAGLDLGPFYASLRYNIGFVDINETSADWRSRGFQALAGLQF